MRIGLYKHMIFFHMLLNSLTIYDPGVYNLSSFYGVRSSSFGVRSKWVYEPHPISGLTLEFGWVLLRVYLARDIWSTLRVKITCSSIHITTVSIVIPGCIAC